jgi:peptidoglycan hydrolase-like protein with peptidoglycan-binding domain
MSTPAYPGRAIQFGETDADVVTLVQQRLIQRGCGPLEITGVFDAKTRSAVRLFQGRFPDMTGVQLVVDGKIGPLTWETLFGEASVVTVAQAPDILLATVVKAAAAEVGVMEDPPPIAGRASTNISARPDSIRRRAASRGAPPSSTGASTSPREASVTPIPWSAPPGSSTTGAAPSRPAPAASPPPMPPPIPPASTPA